MPSLLEAAQRKKAELLKELERLEIFLSTYRELEVELGLDAANEAAAVPLSTENRALVDREQKEADREAAGSNDAPAKRVRTTDNPKPAVVVAATVQVIREAGKPLTRRKIYETLKDRGLEVKGVDPIKALGTMLWRSGADDLVQLEGLGYWLKSEDYEPAQYFPSFV